MLSERDQRLARLVESAGIASRAEIDRALAAGALGAHEDLCDRLARAGLMRADQADWARLSCAHGWSPPPAKARNSQSLVPVNPELLASQPISPDEISEVDIAFQAPIPGSLTQSELLEVPGPADFLETQTFPSFEVSELAASQEGAGPLGLRRRPPPNPPTEPIPGLSQAPRLDAPPPSAAPPNPPTEPIPGLHRSEAIEEATPTRAHKLSAGSSRRTTTASGLEVGPYRLGERLGEGGMGVVYRAYHTVLKSEVALKMILAKGSIDQRALERFEVEAQTMARLQHPNIVRVRDVKLDGRLVYMAMDLVKGENLKEHLKKHGVMAPREGARLGLKVADALQHAHEAGVVHRDLKPANVILTEGDLDPVLTDFGLAKPLYGDIERDLTGSNDIVGTPYYVAPEQLEQSQPVDARADVYSLAATLFEVLTGAPPFASNSSLAVMTQVVTTEAPLLRERMPEAPRALETILARCLAKEPDRRYPSAGAMAEDLRRFLNDKPILAQPVNVAERAQLWTRRNRRALALASGTFLGALLLFWTASVFIQSRDAAERLRAAETVDQLLVETERLRKASEENRRELQERLIATEQERDAARVRAKEATARLLATESARRRESLASIRGRLAEVRRALSEERWDAAAAVAARALRDLDRAPIPQDRARRLRAEQASLARQALRRGGWLWRSPSLLEGEGAALCAAPEASLLAAAAGRVLHLWAGSEGAPEQRFDPGLGPLTAAALSADGRYLAAGAGEGRVAVYDRQEERLIKLRLGEKAVSDLAFAPGGQLLGACGEGGRLRLWSLPSGEPCGELRRQGQAAPLQRLAFDPKNPRLAAASDRLITVWSWTDDARRELTGHEAPITGLGFAAGGAQLVSSGASGFLRTWDPNTGRELKIIKAPGAGLTDLAVGEGGVAAAAADGAVLVLGPEDREPQILGRHEQAARRVVFLGPRSLASLDQSGRVIVWDLARRRSERRLQGHDSPLHGVAFTRSGDRVLSASERGTIHVWSVKTGTRVQTIEAPGTQRCFALSKDDKSLACGFDDGRVAFYSVRRGGRLGGDQPHKSAVLALAFAPRGGFVVSGDRDGLVVTWDAERSRVTRVDEAHDQGVCALAVSPDGRLVASASLGGDLRLWRADTGAELTRLPELGSAAVGLAFSPDSTRLVAASERLVRIYDWKSGREILSFSPGTNPVTCLALDPKGQTIATGSRDASIGLWNSEDGRRLDRFFGHSGAVTGLAFSPDGGGLVSCSTDRCARRWQVRRPRSLRVFRGHAAGVVDVGMAGQGRLIASLSDQGGLRFWDPRTGLETRPRRALAAGGPIGILDSGREVVLARGRALERLDVLGGALQIRYAAARRPVSCLAISESGGLFACGEESGGLELWPLNGSDGPRFLSGHQGRLDAVALSPDGLKLASSCRAGLVYIWETTTGRRLTGIELPPERRVRALRFTADGGRVYLATNDGGVEAWDWLRTGEQRRLGDHPAVRRLALSRDGKLLASGSSDGEVRLWDLDRRFVLARWGAHQGAVTGLVFLDKTARLVSAGGDGLGRVWDLYPLLTPSPLEARANEPETLEVLGGRRLEGARLTPSSAARLLLYRQ